MPLLEYENVSQRFAKEDGDFTACASVNLTIQSGEFVAIVGPSGCGKSTLLNMAAGLLAPTDGRVRYRGRQLDGPNTSVGYLTQRDTLLPWRTLLGNVSLPLEIKKIDSKEREKLALHWISKVGLSGFDGAYPSAMSGGMRRRALLARSLIYQPETILMDEPFGALDAHLRHSMHHDIQELWSETGCTIIMVTHDLGEALALADRVIIFGSRPGRILAEQVIDLPRPRNVRRVRFEKRYSELHELLWDILEQGAPQRI